MTMFILYYVTESDVTMMGLHSSEVKARLFADGCNQDQGLDELEWAWDEQLNANGTWIANDFQGQYRIEHVEEHK